MSTEQKGVLVLGAGGPIGRAIGRRAQDHGLDILLTTRKSKTSPLDATDSRAVHEVLVSRGVRVIVDLSNPEPTASPSTVSALMESVRGTDVARLVYASSAAVYGDGGHHPFAETDPLCGTSAYAKYKIRAERDVKAGASVSGLTAAVMRIFNVYGPGCVKSLANRLVTGPRPTLAMSSDFVRDYVHVNDVADALLMAIQSDIGGVFNVATGVGTTNLDLAGAVEPAAFEPSEPITSYSVGDPSVIHERLGWRAHRSVVADVASGAL